MRTAIYKLDAFTTRRFSGNPAAVMPLETFLDDATLQAVAAENNLAETAFLVPEGAAYRLRWCTPTVEVPFCGHATLASAAVVMERLEPTRTEVVFHTQSGPLFVRRRATGYVMDVPARTLTTIAVPSALVAALGATPSEAHVDSLTNYVAVFAEPRIVRELAPDLAAVAKLDAIGVIVTAPGDDGFDIVSRYFAPRKGIPEDPVTGGAHCALAPLWAPRLGRAELHAFQASRRGGELRCRLKGYRVELEGSCVFYLEGEVEI